MGAPAGDGGGLPDSVVLAQAIRQAVLQVPGIVRMSPGRRYVEATYGPGVTVQGVGISMQTGQIEADVHVVATATPLPALAHRLRHAIRTALAQTTPLPLGPVNIYIDDIVLTGAGRREPAGP
jgi:uncharacterized alkaline shock family protein YloU